VNNQNVWALYGVGIAYIHWDDNFPDADLDITMAADECGLKVGQNTVSFTQGGHHGFCPCWPGLAFKVRSGDVSTVRRSPRPGLETAAPSHARADLWDLRGRRVPAGSRPTASGSVLVTTGRGRSSLRVMHPLPGE
jgi:hypothetical protein